MRSLESILDINHDQVKREILFEDGKWCIYRRANDRCYIIHRCNHTTRAHSSMADRCHECNEVMPVALKGLFMLNEWKR